MEIKEKLQIMKDVEAHNAERIGRVIRPEHVRPDMKTVTIEGEEQFAALLEVIRDNLAAYLPLLSEPLRDAETALRMWYVLEHHMHAEKLREFESEADRGNREALHAARVLLGDLTPQNVFKVHTVAETLLQIQNERRAAIRQELEQEGGNERC